VEFETLQLYDGNIVVQIATRGNKLHISISQKVQSPKHDFARLDFTEDEWPDVTQLVYKALTHARRVRDRLAK